MAAAGTKSKWPPLLRREQAAEMTGAHPRYIDKLRLCGVVKTYKYINGSRFMFYRDELLRHFGLENVNERI